MCGYSLWQCKNQFPLWDVRSLDAHVQNRKMHQNKTTVMSGWTQHLFNKLLQKRSVSIPCFFCTLWNGSLHFRCAWHCCLFVHWTGRSLSAVLLAECRSSAGQSWWPRVFCVNTGGQQLGFIAEMKGSGGRLRWGFMGTFGWDSIASCTLPPSLVHERRRGRRRRRRRTRQSEGSQRKSCSPRRWPDSSDWWMDSCVSVIALNLKAGNNPAPSEYFRDSALLYAGVPKACACACTNGETDGEYLHSPGRMKRWWRRRRCGWVSL